MDDLSWTKIQLADTSSWDFSSLAKMAINIQKYSYLAF